MVSGTAPVIAVYLSLTALVVALWLTKLWTLSMTMLAAMMLSLTFTQYSIQQRDVRHQNAIDVKICKDAVNTANVINDFHHPVKKFMQEAARRIHERMANEKPGTTAYKRDARTEAIYKELANSIGLASVEQCTIVHRVN